MNRGSRNVSLKCLQVIILKSLIVISIALMKYKFQWLIVVTRTIESYKLFWIISYLSVSLLISVLDSKPTKKIMYFLFVVLTSIELFISISFMPVLIFVSSVVNVCIQSLIILLIVYVNRFKSYRIAFATNIIVSYLIILRYSSNSKIDLNKYDENNYEIYLFSIIYVFWLDGFIFKRKIDTDNPGWLSTSRWLIEFFESTKDIIEYCYK